MNVYLDTIGCRLNQSEIESYARHFRIAGHHLVAKPDMADLVVINTCAVTQAALADSRKKIRQAAKAIQDNDPQSTPRIVVTGCWSTLQPQEANALPGVTDVIPNDRKDLLVPEILELPPEKFDLEFIERQPVPGIRLRTRAFIKVQDGCDNRCTFCITTLARGQGRSRTADEVLSDIRAAVTGGAKEIVLSGVHLGSWGHDFHSPLHLEHLLGEILEKSDVPRIRLSSLEPWDLNPEFFDLWQDERLCRHLHLPLQSGCGTTLRRMARKTTPKAFANLVEAARSRIPGVAITTDVIVGFPGESETEFEESLSFAAEMEFADGHVFTYSARPGTAAAQMPSQVPHPIRKERNAKMRAVLEESSRVFRHQFLEKNLTVLWENASALGPKGWQMNGLTDNYLRVYSLGHKNLWNELTPVRLERVEDQRLFGSILAPSPDLREYGA